MFPIAHGEMQKITPVLQANATAPIGHYQFAGNLIMTVRLSTKAFTRKLVLFANE